jgi:Domain of unknown function (DUF4129)
LDIRRILPYLVGLIVLALALGTLSRGSPGGSLLFQSYWLLYIIDLGPIAVLGTMVALIVIIGLNWRNLGNAIGYGMANKRKMRKKRSRYAFLVYIGFWGLAIGVLYAEGKLPFGLSNSGNKTITQSLVNVGTPPPNPFQGGIFPTVSSLVQNSWFSFAFIGLLIVAGLVVFQSISASLKETSEGGPEALQDKQLEGLQAVHEAMKLVGDEASDPRSRIISCYQYMITTVSKLGVPVSSDQTARELERAIRSTFSLKGPATGELTQLFEEARYSLHDIVENDAAKARSDLESIADELKVQLND